MERDFELEFTDEIPEMSRGKYKDIFESFLESDKKTLRISCKDVETQRRISQAARAYRNKHFCDFTIFTKLNVLYLVKS